MVGWEGTLNSHDKERLFLGGGIWSGTWKSTGSQPYGKAGGDFQTKKAWSTKLLWHVLWEEEWQGNWNPVVRGKSGSRQDKAVSRVQIIYVLVGCGRESSFILRTMRRHNSLLNMKTPWLDTFKKSFAL